MRFCRAMLCGVLVLLTASCQERGEGAGSQVQDVDQERRASVTAFWSAYRAGLKHARAGETDAAAESLKVALTHDPKHEGALYDYGNACFDLGRYTEAEASWRKLVAEHPHSVRGFAQLGALHSCGQDSTPFDLDAAEGFFRRTHGLNKESSEATVRMGEVFLMQGRVAQALDQFELALAFDRENREARMLKGLVLWIQGDHTEAHTLYASARPSKEKTNRPFASEEGDTRSGSKPLLAEGARHRNFFRSMIDEADAGGQALHVYSRAATRLAGLSVVR